MSKHMESATNLGVASITSQHTESANIATITSKQQQSVGLLDNVTAHGISNQHSCHNNVNAPASFLTFFGGTARRSADITW